MRLNTRENKHRKQSHELYSCEDQDKNQKKTSNQENIFYANTISVCSFLYIGRSIPYAKGKESDAYRTILQGQMKIYGVQLANGDHMTEARIKALVNIKAGVKGDSPCHFVGSKHRTEPRAFP